MNKIEIEDLQGKRVEEQETVLVKGGPHFKTWDPPTYYNGVGMTAKAQVQQKQGR